MLAAQKNNSNWTERTEHGNQILSLEISSVFDLHYSWNAFINAWIDGEIARLHMFALPKMPKKQTSADAIFLNWLKVRTNFEKSSHFSPYQIFLSLSLSRSRKTQVHWYKINNMNMSKRKFIDVIIR